MTKAGDGTTAPSEDDIDGVLVWTVVRAGRRIERIVTDRLAGHGLNPVQFGVLVYLGARPGMSQSDLGRALHVRPQSVRETTATMTDRGLLHRDGPPGRGRRSAMRLTGDGRALLERAWPVVTGIDPADLGLAPDDEPVLNRLLHLVLGASTPPQ